MHIDIYDRKFRRDEKDKLHIVEDGVVEVPGNIREIGYSWHGGQSSPLYSMSSCGSIASMKHKRALLREVHGCIYWVEHAPGVAFVRQTRHECIEELTTLLHFIEEAQFAKTEDSE
jgi:hypothetical protein